MWVVKLGGSLQSSDCLSTWLQMLSEHGKGRIVIVPGGGSFADQVRKSQIHEGFDDKTAHVKAILAMEQFAQTLLALQPELVAVNDVTTIQQTLSQGKTALWFPGKMTIGNPAIPENWDVTSDSLALWLAGELSAEVLILVKSIKLDNKGFSFSDLVQQKCLDAWFPSLFRQKPVPLTCWYDSKEYPLVREALVNQACLRLWKLEEGADTLY